MSAEQENTSGASAQFEKVQAVKRAYAAELMNKPNVVGIGIGYRMAHGERTDQIAIIVLVNAKLPAAGMAPGDLLPREIEGVPVDVQEVGSLRAQ